MISIEVVYKDGNREVYHVERYETCHGCAILYFTNCQPLYLMYVDRIIELETVT